MKPKPFDYETDNDCYTVRLYVKGPNDPAGGYFTVSHFNASLVNRYKNEGKDSEGITWMLRLAFDAALKQGKKD